MRLPPVTTSTTPCHTHHDHRPNNSPHSNIKAQSQILTMSWNPFKTISNMAQLGIPGKPYFLLGNMLQTRFHQKYTVSLVGFPNWHVSRSKWDGEPDEVSYTWYASFIHSDHILASHIKIGKTRDRTKDKWVFKIQPSLHLLVVDVVVGIVGVVGWCWRRRARWKTGGRG